MGGVVSSVASAATGGSKGGSGASGGGYNSIIDGIKQAGGVSAQFSQKAIDALNQYYTQAQNQYSNYYNVARQDLQNANTQSQNILQGGFQQGTQALLGGQQQAQAYLNPYINAGLPALDAYSQSMGLGTPVGGSLQAFNQQQNAAQNLQNTNMAIGNQYQQDLSTYNNAQNTFQNKLNALNTPTGAPSATPSATVPGGFVYDPTSGIATQAATAGTGTGNLVSTIQSAVNQLNGWRTNGDPNWGSNALKSYLSTAGANDLQNATPEQLQTIAKNLAGDFGNLDAGKASPLLGQLHSAASGYVAPTTAQTQNIGLAPTAPTQAQYQQAGPTTTPQMTTAAQGAQQGLQNFYASPEYQALYGGNPTDMTTQSVQERFQNDPGYQFALQQGLKGVQQSAFANGTGYSPAMAQALTQYGTGIASQNFDTYRAGLSNTFNQYQTQLQNLSGMGATASGAGAQLAQQTGQGINNNATNLATGQANINQATGQGLSQNAMNAANATSTLASNQGSNLANAYSGQGTEQANMALAEGQARASQSQYQNSAGANAMGSLGAGLGGLSSLFSSSQGGGGGLGGAASGAAAGSAFGPYGAAAGGILGFFK